MANTYMAIHHVIDSTIEEYRFEPENPLTTGGSYTVTKLLINQADGSQLELTLFNEEAPDELPE